MSSVGLPALVFYCIVQQCGDGLIFIATVFQDQRAHTRSDARCTALRLLYDTGCDEDRMQGAGPDQNGR